MLVLSYVVDVGGVAAAAVIAVTIKSDQIKCYNPNPNHNRCKVCTAATGLVSLGLSFSVPSRGMVGSAVTWCLSVYHYVISLGLTSRGLVGSAITW